MQEGELWNIYRMPEHLENQAAGHQNKNITALDVTLCHLRFSGLASRIVLAGEEK